MHAPFYLSEPVNGLVYTLEPARKGSRKLHATAMLEHQGGDWKVPYRSVPLSVRRAAKRHFGMAN